VLLRVCNEQQCWQHRHAWSFVGLWESNTAVHVLCGAAEEEGSSLPLSSCFALL